MKKIIRFTKYIIFILIIDFLLSNLVLKNKKIWEYEKLIDHYWRVPSQIYHHDLLPNINVIEPWGFNMKKKLITNSLGFRDSSNRMVDKKSEKKRLLLIGDSAIEGAGYDYEFTIGGLFQKALKDHYEVLNSAVGSYSPSIYYKKISHFIQLGYKFDKAIIFLDPSDIIDELFIQWDDQNNILVKPEDKQKNIISNFLLDNFFVFRSLLRLSDGTENIKNFYKLKYKASKKFKKNFFDTTLEDTLFYRMTHVDRSLWTYDENQFANYKEGLVKSKKYLDELIKVLRNNNVEIDFVLYPHPSQIFYQDKNHYPYWVEWAHQNNINLISLYENFFSENKRQLIIDTFIFGDLHWNKKGTKIVFDNLMKKIKF